MTISRGSQTVFATSANFAYGDDSFTIPRLKQAGTLSFESSVHRHGGGYVPVEVTANYLCYDGQEYNCALVHDITERKAAKDRFAKAFQRSPLPTCICAVADGQTACDVKMPKPVLQHKIWIPWADSNQPFFYEDAIFLGRKKDLRKLVTPLTREDIDILADPFCGQFAHVVRYGRIFVSRYPLFAEYLRNYRFFVNDFDYRRELVPHLLNDGFFWHAVVAHAWILHSQFHVDAGRQGEILFYANNVNQNAYWSNPDTLRNAPPYDYIDSWRNGTKPGAAMPSVQRSYGRLADDAWQCAFFTRDLPDFPRATLKRILENVAACRDGRLKGIESDFYRNTAALHERCWMARNENLASARSA